MFMKIYKEMFSFLDIGVEAPGDKTVTLFITNLNYVDNQQIINSSQNVRNL